MTLTWCKVRGYEHTDPPPSEPDYNFPVLMTRKQVMSIFCRGHTFVDALISSKELDSTKDGGRPLIWGWSVKERLKRLRQKK
jgi:hypothetical protein